MAIVRESSTRQESEVGRQFALMESPGAVPGWGLVPGDVRRSIEDTHELHKHMASLFSLQEFLGCCSPSVPILGRAWAKMSGHLDHESKRTVQEISRRAISGGTQRANFSPSQSATAKLESHNADRIPFSAS
jgi:hypothetical protein